MRRLERHRGVAGDPELVLLVGQDVCELGVAQQGLRRDAADVEADTAPVLQLHHCGLETELGGTNGGNVAAGAGAEDDEIEIAHARKATAGAGGACRPVEPPAGSRTRVMVKACASSSPAPPASSAVASARASWRPVTTSPASCVVRREPARPS